MLHKLSLCREGIVWALRKEMNSKSFIDGGIK